MAASVVKPDGTPSRWLQVIVLLLCSALGFGSNFCYHNPAALKNQLQQHFSGELEKNEYEMLFNMLYSLYSTPNIVLPFFGGFLVDRIGAQQMLLLLTSLVLIGQAITAFGSTVASFRLMLVGRVVFGFGGESLGVARTTFISTWFKKRDLGLGGILNNVLSPFFADKFGVSFALWFGAITCAASMMATIVMIPIDHAMLFASPHKLPNGQPRHESINNAIKIGDIKHFGSDGEQTRLGFEDKAFLKRTKEELKQQLQEQMRHKAHERMESRQRHLADDKLLLRKIRQEMEEIEQQKAHKREDTRRVLTESWDHDSAVKKLVELKKKQRAAEQIHKEGIAMSPARGNYYSHLPQPITPRSSGTSRGGDDYSVGFDIRSVCGE